MKKENEKTAIVPSEYAAIFFVKDLKKQIEFYTESIGLQLQWRTEEKAGLGACTSNILLLSRENNSKNKNTLNIELPSRRELAKVIGRLCTIKYPNQQLDYGNKQVTIVHDPEGNEIMIGVAMPGGKALEKPVELDIESLFNELDPDDRLCDKMSENTKVKNASV